MQLNEWLERQRVWSLHVFGPGRRTLGLVSRIRKELMEIEADPGDPLEWIDISILAMDGAHRTGTDIASIVWVFHNLHFLNLDCAITEMLTELEKDNDWLSALTWVKIAHAAKESLFQMGYTWPEIMALLEAKQLVNFAREWPPWQDQNTPTEHDRSKE